ncbi:MAG: hypothetical protein Q7N87_04110 [Candidatus Uhrbacteria bacterium]|nr:hypothetical protein [Candidatus Uhrbacteria bacterium]
MRETALESLLAACRRDATALARLGHQQLDDGEEVIQRLLDTGMSFDDILERIVNANALRNELMVCLSERVTERGARNRLIEAVIEIDGMLPHPFPATVATLFGSGEDLQYIFRRFRALVTDTNHYLFAHLSADRLWQDRVAWHLAKPKPDHVRAMDEFWRAFKGFPIYNDRRSSPRGEFTDRCYRASIKCLIRLINEIYESMIRTGCVSALRDRDIYSIAATPTKVGSAMSLLVDRREMNSRMRAKLFLIDQWVRDYKASAQRGKQRRRTDAAQASRRSS